MAAPPDETAAEAADQVPGQAPLLSSPPTVDIDNIDVSKLCAVPPLPVELKDNLRFRAWHRTETLIARERDEFDDRLRYYLMTPGEKGILWRRAIGKKEPPRGAKRSSHPADVPDLGTPPYETKKRVAPRWTGPVLRAIQRTGKVNEALMAARVDENNYFLWKSKDPAFARAVDRAFVEAASLIEGKLLELATEGEKQGVYFKGKKVGEEKRVSVPAAKLLLEGLRPERYVAPAALVENQQAAGRGNGLVMNITINALGPQGASALPASLRLRSGALSLPDPDDVVEDAEIVEEPVPPPAVVPPPAPVSRKMARA